MASATGVNNDHNKYNDHDSTHYPLTEIEDQQEFSCAGCKTIGHGKRLNCTQCDFTLHPFCADCPIELTTFMHTAHPLHLLMSPPATLSPGSIYVCDICGDHINGAHYLCSLCDFGFHPCCSQLPRAVIAADTTLHDSSHPLKLLLQPTEEASCDVCREDCNPQQYLWYKCVRCDVDAHIWCLLKGNETGPHGPPPFRDDDDDGDDSLAAAQIAARYEQDARDFALDLWSDDEYEYVYKKVKVKGRR